MIHLIQIPYSACSVLYNILQLPTRILALYPCTYRITLLQGPPTGSTYRDHLQGPPTGIAYRVHLQGQLTGNTDRNCLSTGTTFPIWTCRVVFIERVHFIPQQTCHTHTVCYVGPATDYCAYGVTPITYFESIND